MEMVYLLACLRDAVFLMNNNEWISCLLFSPLPIIDPEGQPDPREEFQRKQGGPAY